MPINFGVWDFGVIKGAANSQPDSVKVDAFYFNARKTLGESLDMLFKRKHLAIVASHHLIDAVAEIGAAITIGRVEFFERYDSILYHRKLHSFAPKTGIFLFFCGFAIKISPNVAYLRQQAAYIVF
jgi:hypothetical protein